MEDVVGGHQLLPLLSGGDDDGGGLDGEDAQVFVGEGLLEETLVACDEEEREGWVFELHVVVVEVGGQLVGLVGVGAAAALQPHALDHLVDLGAHAEGGDL